LQRKFSLGHLAGKFLAEHILQKSKGEKQERRIILAERVGFELEAFCGRQTRSRNPGVTGTAVIMAERVGLEPANPRNFH